MGKIPGIEEIMMRCELILDGVTLNRHDLYQERVKFICRNGVGGNTAIMTSLPSEKAMASVLLFCGIASYYYNTITVKELIDEIQDGDTALYGYTRVQVLSRFPELKVKESNGTITIIPEKKWNQVVCYNKKTDNYSSVGVQKAANSSDRRFFFSELFAVDEYNVLPELNSISVIVADKDEISSVIRKLEVRINGQKNIRFLDLFTATYVTSRGDEKDYPGNSWNGTPNIFICRDVKSAGKIIDDYTNRGEYTLASLYFVSENALVKGKEQAIMMMNECGARINIADIGFSVELGSVLKKDLVNSEVFQMNTALKMKKIMERIDPILYKAWHSFSKGNVKKILLPLDLQTKE